MEKIRQRVIPAARHIADLDHLVKQHFEYAMMLQIHLAQLKYVMDVAHSHRVKLILHADLIQGLKPDEYGAQYLCQEIKPDGIISTHSQVIETAKKRGVLSIQRVFLLDSHSLETSYRVIRSIQPDYIEVLPGIAPELIQDVVEETRMPVLAGGFLRKPQQVQAAFDAGALAVTTSNRALWDAGF